MVKISLFLPRCFVNEAFLFDFCRIFNLLSGFIFIFIKRLLEVISLKCKNYGVDSYAKKCRKR